MPWSFQWICATSCRWHSWKVNWFIGDLAHLPIQSKSMEVILDIFSPANYAEFERVLEMEGVIIKVVPTSSHLERNSSVGPRLSNYTPTRWDFRAPLKTTARSLHPKCLVSTHQEFNSWRTWGAPRHDLFFYFFTLTKKMTESTHRNRRWSGPGWGKIKIQT